MLVHQVLRMGSPNIMITRKDGLAIPDDLPFKFTKVICDVPCSGDGTLRKNRTAMSQWNMAKIYFSFFALQVHLLLKALSLTAIGGLVSYSTCSLNPVEDEAVVQTALEILGKETIEILPLQENEFEGFKLKAGLPTWQVVASDLNKTPTPLPLVDKHEALPANLKHMIHPGMLPNPRHSQEMKKVMRVLPHQNDTGGFFMALIQKKKDFDFKTSLKEIEKLVGPFSSGDTREKKEQEKDAKKPTCEGVIKRMHPEEVDALTKKFGVEGPFWETLWLRTISIDKTPRASIFSVCQQVGQAIQDSRISQ